MHMRGCVTPEQMAEYVAGQLPLDRAQSIAAHLAGCIECERVADTLTDDTELRQLQSYLRRAEFGETELSVPVAAPETIGRFRLLERLGAGAFAVVYLAEDTQLHRQVALKVPHAYRLADPDMRARFLREVRAAAALHHPQIVAVHDAGECNEILFLAAAYCPGKTLQDWMQGNRRLISADEAALVVLALAEAAQHAHEQGVLHRDIKPQNVLLDSTATFRRLAFCPKLTDFSIAKLIDDSSDATATMLLMGTPRYMSPEQATGRRDLLGPTCDIYSLGVILYELLTKQTPTPGENNTDILRRLVSDEPISPRRHSLSIPRDLEAICLKCLEKTPAKRYATARELADDLERFLARQPTIARPVSAAERSWRWIKRHPARATLMSVVLLASLMLFCGLLLYNERLQSFNVGLSEALGNAKRAEARAVRSEQQTQLRLYVSDMRLGGRALSDGDTRTLAQLLRHHIPSPGQPDYRGIEWHFLSSQANVKHETLADEVGNAVYQLQLSPDGKYLASVGRDAVLRIYELSSGGLVQSVKTGQGEVNGVAFSPDGQRVATAGDDGAVRIWNRADGELLVSNPAHAHLAFGVKFSPDGSRILTCGNEPIIRCWDAYSGAPLSLFVGNQKAVEAIALSARGSWLASAGADCRVRVWNLDENREIWQAKGRWPGFVFTSVAFSPDGNLTIAGDVNRELSMWNTKSGIHIASGQHLDSVYAVACSSDGRYIASGDACGVLCLWDVVIERDPSLPDEPIEMKPLRRLQAHSGRVSSLVFEGENLISTGYDGKILKWEIENLVAQRHARNLDFDFYRPVFNASNQLLATNEMEGLVSFTLADETTLDQLELPPCSGSLLCADGAGSCFALLSDNAEIECYEHVSKQPRKVLKVDADRADIQQMALSRDGSRIAVQIVGTPNVVQVFETRSGAIISTTELPPGNIGQVAISPNGTHVAVISPDDVLLLSVDGGVSRHIKKAHEGILDLKYSPSGSVLATCGRDRLVQLWDSQTGKHLGTLSGHRGEVVSITFSNDGRSLISSDARGLIKIWSVAAREELLDVYQQNHLGVRDLSLSPDDRWLAGVSEHYLELVLIDLGDSTAGLNE